MISTSTMSKAIDARNAITSLQVAAAQGNASKVETKAKLVMKSLVKLLDSEFALHEVTYWLEESLLSLKALNEERPAEIRTLVSVAITLTAEIDAKFAPKEKKEFYINALQHATSKLKELNDVEEELAICILRDDFLIELLEGNDEDLARELKEPINAFIDELESLELSGGFQRV